MRAQIAVLALAALLLGLGASEASAASTIRVPADHPTIQSAIDVASTGDTILVSPGTYHEHIDFLGKGISLIGEGGAAQTTIDGDFSGAATVAINSVASSATVSGFTIRGGSQGGLDIQNSVATVDHNKITGNGVAGINAYNAANAATVQILSNEIIGNEGSGIWLTYPGFVTIDGNVIAENTAPTGGAGIRVDAAEDATITNNVIRDNHSGDKGGGILLTLQQPLVAQNLIVRNSAAHEGGGIAALVPIETTLNMRNNTIADNAGLNGSDVWLGGSMPNAYLQNNIIRGSSSEAALFCDGTFSPSPPEFRSNLFASVATLFAGTCGDPLASAGNLLGDPLFVDPANGDYHLTPHSPAVDAGDGDLPAPPSPLSDIDGEPRVADGNGDGQARIDIGYDELQPGDTRTPAATPSPAPTAAVLPPTGGPQEKSARAIVTLLILASAFLCLGCAATVAARRRSD